jgi:Acyl-CoA thioester hydrolase/BAAT N-terminal region
MIVVDQPDALIDQPIAIALRGFAPRQQVSVTATQTYAETTSWQSRATSACATRRVYAISIRLAVSR